MKIKIDDQEYNVSMTWLDNEDVELYVSIEGQTYPLNLVMSKSTDKMSYTKAKQIITDEIRHLLFKLN